MRNYAVAKHERAQENTDTEVLIGLQVSVYLSNMGSGNPDCR
jgi:hypothetical protein